MTLYRPFAIVALAFLPICGCHQPATPVAQTGQTFVLRDEEELEGLWETCQTVLRQNRFRLDRVDRRAGVITTFPVTSQQFFEFWRHDVDAPYDLLDASLHTVRRRAAVELVPVEGESLAGTVMVTVRKERLSAPERQLNDSAGALRVFSSGVPGEAGERQLTRADDYWINEGRDGAMEQRLLAQISNAASFVEARPVPTNWP